jgi:hypothetical protein
MSTFSPKADILTVYSIASPRLVSTVSGEANPSALIAARLIASAQNGRTIPRMLEVFDALPALRNSIIPEPNEKSGRRYYNELDIARP